MGVCEEHRRATYVPNEQERGMARDATIFRAVMAVNDAVHQLSVESDVQNRANANPD